MHQILLNIINYNTEIDFASNENISPDLAQSFKRRKGDIYIYIYNLTETLLLEAGL